MKLSSRQVCQITGITPRHLLRWVEFDFVKPQHADDPTGMKHLYTLSQCIAIATAWRYRDQGATFDRLVGLLQYLSNLPVERLEAELEDGRTFPVPSTMIGMDWIPGMMVSLPKGMPREARQLAKRLDMRPIVKDVMRKVDRLPPPRTHKRKQHGGLAKV